MTQSPVWADSKISTEEDSADLTDNEVERAVVTVGFNQLAQLLARALAPEHTSVGNKGRYAVERHEIRRRSPHLYLKSYLVCPGAPPKVVLHRVDWMDDAS
jgi:hypothetical protein